MSMYRSSIPHDVPSEAYSYHKMRRSGPLECSPAPDSGYFGHHPAEVSSSSYPGSNLSQPYTQAPTSNVCYDTASSPKTQYYGNYAETNENEQFRRPDYDTRRQEATYEHQPSQFPPERRTHSRAALHNRSSAVPYSHTNYSESRARSESVRAAPEEPVAMCDGDQDMRRASCPGVEEAVRGSNSRDGHMTNGRSTPSQVSSGERHESSPSPAMENSVALRKANTTGQEYMENGKPKPPPHIRGLFEQIFGDVDSLVASSSPPSTPAVGASSTANGRVNGLNGVTVCDAPANGARKRAASNPNFPPANTNRPLVCVIERPLECTLEDMAHGSVKRVKVDRTVVDGGGGGTRQTLCLEIPVRPGWKAGKKVRFEGVGDVIPGQARQDIEFVITEKPHQFLCRATPFGADLSYLLRVDKGSLVTGFAAQIPTLSGFQEVVVEGFPDGQAPRSIVMEGEGMPDETGRRGDLVVTIKVAGEPDEQPSNLAAFQRRCIEEMWDSMDVRGDPSSPPEYVQQAPTLWGVPTGSNENSLYARNHVRRPPSPKSNPFPVSRPKQGFAATYPQWIGADRN
eukprot:comp22931_c0_seq1/m.36324 comp22931_c0_seq1/g.36324  ORF comp22931_c0_seq1/g.36324 comp22931_c0_seq1/m.36324 type:complete len:570 (-) comp22931_c0_seq1:599-2308(-)